MQRLEQEKAEQARPRAEQARLMELKAQERETRKHRDWERQVLLLEECDEGARLNTFFEILLKRLDLPASSMEAEDFPEWVKEHGDALSFLYQEPQLPEKCGPSGALTRNIKRLTSSLMRSDVTVTPPDVTKHLRSQIEEVPLEIARLRSARNWLKVWFVTYLYVSVCFFSLFAVCCLDLSGLTLLEQTSPPKPGPVVGATVIEALVFAGGALGTLSIAILLGLRWKRKEAEFQKRQLELQEVKSKLGQEISRLQAEVAECCKLAISEAGKAKEHVLHDLAEAVEEWRLTVCNEFVKDFFEQGLWISDRFAERLKALLAEIQRPFPTSCRVEINSLRDDQIERAFSALTAVIASTIAAKVDLGSSSTLAQLIVSGTEPGVPMPSAEVVLERLESEGVLLKGDQLSHDTKSRMTEVLQTLRA
jgi:hypothetical protein